MVDLRYHWVRQKRLQGCHGSNDEQARGWWSLLNDGVIDPVVGQVLTFDEIGEAHQEMADGGCTSAEHGDPRGRRRRR